MNGKELANACANFVNSYNYDTKGFVETMCNEHKTLQQSFTKLIVEFLKKQANNNYDDRNKSSVMFAKKVVELIEKEKIVLPLI